MREAESKRGSFTRGVFLGLIAVLLTVPQWATAQISFSRIIVFGTSLSDTGNAFALVGGRNTPPDYSVDFLLVPDRPYARGGHHFTNGATWVEQLARPMGLAGSVQPALRSSGGGTNFAVGGARARPDDSGVDLSSQVTGFLTAVSGRAPADALYVVEMGGNDLRDALVAGLTGGGDPTSILTGAVQSIAGNIYGLYQAGARKFLVWNGLNVGLTPAAQALGGAAAIPGGALAAKNFNDGLNFAFYDPRYGLTALLPGIQIVTLDVNAQLNTLYSSPASSGLSNVTQPCIQPGVAPFQCQNPDDYLFWDGIHPTAAVHGMVAQYAATVLPR